VASPMRRTIFLALFAALLFPTAALATSSGTIIRDCADDSILQGHYSVADLRKALDQVPKDVNEYSDCSDVISRAIANQTTRDNSGNSGSAGSGGGASGGGGGTGGGGSQGSSAPRHHANAAAQDGIVGASTAQDHQAVNEAAIRGGGTLKLGGHSVVPGTLASNVGRNGLPGALIAALALLCVLGLAATAPLVRRRVVAHRQA
jgi:hypothetical protein